MATSDATVAFSQIDQDAVTLTDGASTTTTLAVQKGVVTWVNATPPVSEMMVRNKHGANAGLTTTVRKTGDSTVTGSIKLYVTTLRGTTGVSPYELLTNGAGTSTGAGDGGMFSMAVPYTGDGGAPSQTATFAYTRFSNVSVDYEEGLMVISADFIDYENKPTIA